MKRLALVTLLLFAATIAFAGAPLKGVDVKLGKNPGGSPAKRTTDPNGNFDFGVQPKGSYYLMIDSSPDASGFAEITINGAVGGTKKVNWDLKSKKTEPTARSAAQEKIILESDGTHPLNGTIVKSKSNISNN